MKYKNAIKGILIIISQRINNRNPEWSGTIIGSDGKISSSS
jgi:hypothetical protein